MEKIPLLRKVTFQCGIYHEGPVGWTFLVIVEDTDSDI